MATVPPGPLTGLAGSGGPDFFRVLNLAGWVKDWNPLDGTYGEKGLLVAEATPNPALVLGLGPAVTEAQVKQACAEFGDVSALCRGTHTCCCPSWSLTQPPVRPCRSCTAGGQRLPPFWRGPRVRAVQVRRGRRQVLRRAEFSGGRPCARAARQAGVRGAGCLATQSAGREGRRRRGVLTRGVVVAAGQGVCSPSKPNLTLKESVKHAHAHTQMCASSPPHTPLPRLFPTWRCLRAPTPMPPSGLRQP